MHGMETPQSRISRRRILLGTPRRSSRLTQACRLRVAQHFHLVRFRVLWMSENTALILLQTRPLT